ncbi:ATP-binding protein [Colwellia sp. 75C3]|uniref:ATP-binding protein n=1 Tax=Colwellia sp. 75C3 TaxID=888425 RepID=UPI0018E29FDE|nr:ATP-binding protein [Colwellia sp. 75C3]
MITADKIYALEHELLRMNVSNIISNSDHGYKTISALGMEKVAFYSDATKKGVVQDIEKNLTPGTSVAIFDTQLNEIVYLVGNEALGQSMTVEHIKNITKQNLIGPHEYDFILGSGKKVTTLLEYGKYPNWNWIIVSFVNENQLLKYSKDAMKISSAMAGVFIILIFIAVFKLSNRISRAIIALEEGAHQLSTNKMDVKIDMPGNDEFTSLASSFNLMSTAIKNTETKLRQSICDEKKTNLSLIDSRKQYYDLIEGMPDIITRVSVDGSLLFVNKAATIMFGLSAKDCIGKFAFDFIHPDDQLLTQQYFSLWLGNKKDVFLHENRQVNIDGQIFYVAWSIRREYDEFDNLIGFVSTGRDITENKRNLEENSKLESQLIQAQKMEAVGQLAGGIAHDFNNMLGVILGHAELALHESEGSSALTSHLKDIIIAGHRSADLTKQLLTYARKQSIEPKIINLNDSISSMLTMLQRLIDENIELTFEQGTNLGLVKIDPSQMDQMLANFCINASDAIDTFGKIIIKTENCSINELSTEKLVIPTGHYVKLSVSDNGSGIDKEVIKHIFEPFYTTKDVGKGTGLGLSTIFGAVKQNKGYIEVISELNQGTTFNMYFRSENNMLTEKNEIKVNVDCFGKATVLIVEDDEMLLDIQTITLEQYGYKVLSANTTSLAETLAREYDGKIDLLLTDVIMPVMNGKEVADKLRGLYPKIRILYMSGYTADIIANKGVIYDNTNFIQKPFGNKALAYKVKEVLEGLST